MKPIVIVFALAVSGCAVPHWYSRTYVDCTNADVPHNLLGLRPCTQPPKKLCYAYDPGYWGAPVVECPK